MSRRFDDAGEIGGRDPLDRRVGVSRPRQAGRLGALLQTRAALGLPPLVAPALVFVPLGVALGPRGASLVSSDSAWLVAVASVALAALGIFVGLALGRGTRMDRRLVAAASLEAVTTIAVVTIGVWLLLARWQIPLPLSAGACALALGIAAAASSAGFLDDERDASARTAVRIADFDDIVPILAGGMLLAFIARPTATGMLALLALNIGAGAAVGLAGWLLFEGARSDAERGVFVVGSVLLVGGMAAYLALSPLVSGLAAGLVWAYTPGRADQIIRDDLRKVQHPLVVLLLVAAGALLTFDSRALWLAAPYLLCRLTGKLAGGWLASRLATGLAPADLGALLVAPGIIGIAFAFALRQAAEGPGTDAILSAVTLGTLASELVAAFVVPSRDAA